ncbi:MAG: 16S rRNA (adenine(1518)-N(6)/adenine(1519)-N(6))-dimethyltransferase [Candidatus Omnitrophica bacterium CG_4_8_14_3_um_filter_43_15]|nr:MAG: hypothetical protein AUJ89_06140 [Candidatus Omnitrophica bacterium CG1_02_43_210]PIW79735.1 MAG: 16S rRNA (adenine(1518)-N(6)/adenine(1519)-N(6))-dimethyltransferase [Candidatus Omnitrophica bacterium CG_4_8_14_3_um_filter_43_15]
MDKIRPIKKLGQNFLRNENILQRIAAAAQLDNNDIVLEIGAGTGNLTKYLCEKTKFVYAVEKDARLCKIAEENLRRYKNVKIICKDILKIDMGSGFEPDPISIDRPFKIIGNLPYYITTPIIFHLLVQKKYINDIIIMVQKEVAQRIIAKPGGKDYGILSCSVQFHAKPKILFNVIKAAFRPQPKVDSSVLKLKILEKPAVAIKDEKLFFNIIKAAFGKRRKMLRSSLAGLITKDKLTDILAKSGIDETRRAETLSLEEFAKILDKLY